MTVQVEMQVFHCGRCAGSYALNANYVAKKRENGGFWHCPYCESSWGYSHEQTEIAKLKRKLEYEEAAKVREQQYAKQEREARERTERQLSATRGVVTKIKKRVGNGVCPCCNRQFADLHRHMKSQHPTFAEPTQ